MNIQWETPQALFDLLNKRFKFVFDVAAAHDNTKAAAFSTDSLGTRPWVPPYASGAVWCNPPYNLLPEFITRAAEEARQHNLTIVMLIPAYTDTGYWHDVVLHTASEIVFLRGRLRFELGGQPKDGARFPSALVIWRGERPSWQTTPVVSWLDWRKEIPCDASRRSGSSSAGTTRTRLESPPSIPTSTNPC